MTEVLLIGDKNRFLGNQDDVGVCNGRRYSHGGNLLSLVSTKRKHKRQERNLEEKVSYGVCKRRVIRRSIYYVSIT